MTLKSDQKGLSSAEAASRLEKFGPNELMRTSGASLGKQILPLLTNPLAIILVVASVLSAVVGDWVSAVLIIVMVLLGAAINFVQTARSHGAIERLRAGVAPTATALRDDSWIEVPRRSVVKGDVIRLSAGDLVPADAILREAKDLHVQEAALTGESLPAEKEAHSDDERRKKVFLGTSVVSGTGVAEVQAIGTDTQFGDIAARLATRPPETEFDRGVRHFGWLIMKTVFVLVLAVLFVNVALKRDPIESLLFAIALAVGLTPEFLPMISAVTLSRGALAMAKQHVVVKHLAAMQNFGSIDILCSDKTGTLTEGVLSVDRYVDPRGKPRPRVLELARINSTLETGIASPLDAAILAVAGATKVTATKVDEIPYDFERRRVSVVVDVDGKRLMVCKGAPESVLETCTASESESGTTPFGESDRKACIGTYQSLGREGFRVLAVAYAEVASKAAYSLADERGLTLVGFLAFVDPPRRDTVAALADLARDGVEVKILTGDNELVTQHICAAVGLRTDATVLGTDIDRMTDAALAHVAETTTIFARVTPGQKNRVIVALKSRSHVVGFLGDGINDAPSLHAADVGITVSTAVDIAKDAADIVLLAPGLLVLHQGIIEGRKAFGNVIKYLLMGTSSNFGNMFSMAGAALFLPFLPMLPTQILLNNFLYDLAQITIPTDRVDATFIRKPRRWDVSMIRRFMLLVGPISSLYDFLTFYVLLHVFKANEATFHTGWFIESLATQTLVVFVIRTAGNPLESRPSGPLLSTVLGVVAIGLLLPLAPFASKLGFVPLPASFFLFLTGATATYLALVEFGKRRLTRALLGGDD